jgi:group I intron endonuclease
MPSAAFKTAGYTWCHVHAPRFVQKAARIGYIYLIRNLVNGKGYVGLTLDTDNRWQGHIIAAFVKNSQYPLHRAMRKYGLKNFSAEILHTCTEGLLPTLERRYVKDLNTHVSGGRGYNQTYGGDGVLGLKFSEASKRRLSTSLKKYFAEHPEAGEAITAFQTGRKQSEETRAKRSVSCTGRRHTAETKLTQSEAALARWKNPVYRANQAAALSSAAHKARRSESARRGALKRYAKPEERERARELSRAFWARPGFKAQMSGPSGAISKGMQKVLGTPTYSAKMSRAGMCSANARRARKAVQHA